MIEISFGKLVLLALVALIVLGPEKLPGVARTAGALLRRARNGWDNVRAEVERELQVEEIKRHAREAAAQAEAAQANLNATVNRVREPFAEAASIVSPAAPAPAAASDTAAIATETTPATTPADAVAAAPVNGELPKDVPHGGT
ncbi:Sec-independent protein translocase protein TatB [Dyella silvatica]|uniref:Sec-independent protein translocase protein TatB n=1 Tax=Dyella silvatica TaxID=2992128 RepID=UPI002255C172|nr:Sec-independent protein translocase protein TatB [Dyella silvatica]